MNKANVISECGVETNSYIRKVFCSDRDKKSSPHGEWMAGKYAVMRGFSEEVQGQGPTGGQGKWNCDSICDCCNMVSQTGLLN